MNHRGLHRFAVLTALSTLALIGVGGLVTSHGVGLAVPDWPNTYGYNPFLFPFSKWVGGIFYEHSHRLVAAAVGLLTSVLAMWLWIRGTPSGARYWGVGAMGAVLVLMGVRQMPVYYALAGLAPVVIAISLYLALQVWRSESSRRRLQPDDSALNGAGALRWLGMAAFAAVVLQGVLGGLRVVWLKDQIGIVHAALAQLFLVLLCLIALLTSRWWAALKSTVHSPQSTVRGLQSTVHSLGRLFLLATALILFQLILGATMRHQHAGLAIPDFPLAYGKLWPAMDPASVAHYNQQRFEMAGENPITAFQIALQMAHRLVALLVLVAVAGCAWAARRQSGRKSALSRLSLVWLGLIGAQALLGAASIWSGKAADVATAHVVGGALALALGAMLTLISLQETPSVGATEPDLCPEGTTASRPTFHRWEPAGRLTR